MRWSLSYRADPRARVIADRHYNRQSVGAAQFVPPGRCLVLLAESDAGSAFWVTSWPFAQYVHHAWGGAWMCSAFRNESPHLSSELIREACAASRAVFGDPPPLGMVTFVDASRVRPKRDPGRCYLKAGFRYVGKTRGGAARASITPRRLPGGGVAAGRAVRVVRGRRNEAA